MPKLNQRGVAHIFLILFLIAGLAVAVYLVKQKTNILPKAYEVPTPSSSGCYARLGRFFVDKPCAEAQNGFRSASFDCLALAGSVLDSSNQAPAHNIGTPETCKVTEDWLKEANNICQSICQNTDLTPTPASSPSATPIPDMSGISKVPVNLSVSCMTGNMAKLNWDSVPGATYYKIKVFPHNSEVINEQNQGDGSDNFVTTKGVRYDGWQVSACNSSDECSGYSFVGDSFACPK